MKRLMAAALCLFLAGCDYEVPIAEEPTAAVDERILGLWQATDEDGQTSNLLVLPLSEREYMVSYPSGSRDSMYARAAHCEAAGVELIQLRWFGTGKGTRPDTKRTYQYGLYSVEDGKLVFRLLNPEVVDREAKTTGMLVELIAAQKDNPDLFRAPVDFQKVDD